MRSPVVLPLILCSILIGCGPSPDTAFNGPFPERNKNLWWKLGSEFTLLKANGDTVTYDLEFIRDGRKTLIIDGRDDDTAFHGPVSKYKGLYYFGNKLNDSTYYIHAVDIEKGLFTSDPSIRGFNKGPEQMKLIEKKIEEGRWSELVKERDSGRILLQRKDKDLLHKVYSQVLDSFPKEPLIDPEPVKEKPIDKADSISAPESGVRKDSASNESHGGIESLFPNPASSTSVRLEMSGKGPWHYKIYNAEGDLVIKESFRDRKVRIDIGNLSEGFHLIRVSKNEKEVGAKKLVISR